MKTLRIIAYLLLLILVGCANDKNTIFVWNMKDVIGLTILGAFFTMLILVFVYSWICDKIDSWKRKRK